VGAGEAGGRANRIHEAWPGPEGGAADEVVEAVSSLDSPSMRASLRKYFCAWLRTCCTVRVPTAWAMAWASKVPQQRSASTKRACSLRDQKRPPDLSLPRAKEGSGLRALAATGSAGVGAARHASGP